MNDYYSLNRGVAQTCVTIMDWCAKGIDYVSYLKTKADLAESQKHSLDYWQDAFRELEMKSKTIVETGNSAYYDPLTVNQLLQEVRLLQEQFNHFIQTQSTEKAAISSVTNVRSDNDSSAKPVPIGGHTLPPLPYAYNALEPHIDEKTMRLHHDKHHKAYVDGLNKAEKMMERARKTGDFDLITHWEREAAFHGAGHYLHTIFWNNMMPRGGGEPTGRLLAQINQDFGNFGDFKKHFSAAAEKAEAVGWAILVWSPRAHRLEILQAEKHQNLSQWDVIPLLVLDVWEHAYYLKYQNNRKSYIEAWWNVVNWVNVNERYEKALMLTWMPY